ncbi:MAG: peptidylprolyl isomerase [Desulfobulbus propionicus]|nr:MAG: peptidylprolyl isomerase [Desulfobulbus propionicus]
MDFNYVQDGKKVAIHYTLKLENGKIFESTAGEEPLTYTHGTGEIVAGLEKNLIGMKAGDIKSFMVEPKDGYGEVTLDSLIEIPREHIPFEARQVGEHITAVSPKGQQIEGTIYEEKGKFFVVDFNHPLAGMNLYFDVTVVSVG